MKKIKNTLKLNSYPNNIVLKYIQKQRKTLQIRTNNKIKDKNECNKNTEDELAPKNKFIAITYHESVTKKINKILKKETNTKKIALKPHFTLKNAVYTKLKYSTKQLDRSNIIYKINCINCDLSYVGQTKQYLGMRL